MIALPTIAIALLFVWAVQAIRDAAVRSDQTAMLASSARAIDDEQRASLDY